jgi:hypothetical protein
MHCVIARSERVRPPAFAAVWNLRGACHRVRIGARTAGSQRVVQTYFIRRQLYRRGFCYEISDHVTPATATRFSAGCRQTTITAECPSVVKFNFSLTASRGELSGVRADAVAIVQNES